MQRRSRHADAAAARRDELRERSPVALRKRSHGDLAVPHSGAHLVRWEIRRRAREARVGERGGDCGRSRLDEQRLPWQIAEHPGAERRRKRAHLARDRHCARERVRGGAARRERVRNRRIAERRRLDRAVCKNDWMEPRAPRWLAGSAVRPTEQQQKEHSCRHSGKRKRGPRQAAKSVPILIHRRKYTINTRKAE